MRAPINPFRPRKLSSRGVDSTIDDFARCAVLAREAGYDGVEIMGSEGYLLNQFLTPRTNKRSDAWGGTPQKRRRFPVEIVRRTRAAVGRDFIICYRMSMADYVEDGQSWDEIVALATEVEAAGATIINSGFGWHHIIGLPKIDGAAVEDGIENMLLPHVFTEDVFEEKKSRAESGEDPRSFQNSERHFCAKGYAAKTPTLRTFRTSRQSWTASTR